MLLAICFVGLVSCATPPDVPICFPLDERTGYCFNTVSEVEYQVDDVNLFEDKSESNPALRFKTWQQLHAISPVAPPYSYAKIKAYIQANCKRDADCNSELSRWQHKVNRAEKKYKSGRTSK